MTLEHTIKIKAYSEEEAKNIIEGLRSESKTAGYVLKKAGYEYKTKKAKGEIVAEAWVVTATKVFGALWEDIGE